MVLCQAALLKVLAEECLYPVEGNLLEVVVEVGVDCAGDDEQLLVVALELLVGVLAEIAGMGVLAVNEEDFSPAYVRSGILRKDNEEVLFHPLLELSERP